MGFALVAAVVAAAALAAAPAKPGAPRAEDLKPLYANASDVAEGKRVAESACATCHGINGISTVENVPHLAGQRAAYLYAEVNSYRSGARASSAMGSAVKFLNDDALVHATAYYASLDPPSPLAANAKTAAPRADPLQAGKTASAACAGCHGDNGTSKTAGTPSLAGLGAKYLVAAMAAYKSGKRKSDAMQPFAAMLSDTDASNVALYFAAQKRSAPTPATGSAAAGKTAAASCSGCHGENGESPGEDTPALASQDAQYIAAALKAYKTGARGDDTMKSVVSALDEATMRNLGAYYASLAAGAPKGRKSLSLAELTQRCDLCHGVNGNSTDPRLPALASQRLDYLQKVLQQYRTEERRSSSMHAMTELLTDADVENLANHYARQKARAVVYVPMPAK
ncbi:MAG TPA: c-type cytochrome [Casimicrobiaceae bacterium]|nr:c-type cytochrome [Casimicrobiaceae bacterium]